MIGSQSTRNLLDQFAFFFLLVFGGWYFSRFLEDGLPLFFDAHSHLARNWFSYEALKEGEYPGWTNYWYGGFRFSEFYGPLFYWVNGALSLANNDVIFTSKVFLFLAQNISLVGTYYLFRSLKLGIFSALVGAFVFATMPVFGWILAIIGNYPSSIMIALTPWLLASTVKYAYNDELNAKQQSLKFAVITTLTVSLILGAHFSNAIVNIPSIFLFQGGCLWWAQTDRQAGYKKLKVLILAYVGAIGMTSFVWLPFLLDLNGISLSLSILEPPKTNLDSMMMLRVLGVEGYSWSSTFIRGHGFLWCAVALVAVLLSFKSSYSHLRGAVFALAGGLIICQFFSDRAIILVPIYIAALVASLTNQAILILLAKKGRLISFCFVTLVTIFNAVSASRIILPDPHYQSGEDLALYKKIAKTDSLSFQDVLSQSRTFDITPSSISLNGFYGNSSFSPYFSGRPISFGAFPQGASRGSELNMALMSVWRALCTNNSDDDTARYKFGADVLLLNNVQYMVDTKNKCALNSERFSVFGKEVEPGLYEMRGVSPILFAPKVLNLDAGPNAKGKVANPLLDILLARWHSDPDTPGVFVHKSMQSVARTRDKQDWQPYVPYIEKMKINHAEHTAESFYIFSKDIADREESGTVDFKLLSHEERSQHVKIRAISSIAGYVRLSYSYDSDLSVLLDGKQVPFAEDAIGRAFVVAFPAGEHELVIVPPRFRLIKALTLGYFVFIILGVTFLLIPERRTNGIQK